MKADLRMALRQLEKRGAKVSDVDSGLTTAKEGHRRAMLALADQQIGRSNRGAKSALNGAHSRGRPVRRFTADELRDAKAVWRNVKDFPTWADAENGMPKDFTAARAFRLWRGRH